MHTTYILITNFSKEKIFDKKILAILLQFAKIFSLQNFVLYSIGLERLCTILKEYLIYIHWKNLWNFNVIYWLCKFLWVINQAPRWAIPA